MKGVEVVMYHKKCPLCDLSRELKQLIIITLCWDTSIEIEKGVCKIMGPMEEREFFFNTLKSYERVNQVTILSRKKDVDFLLIRIYNPDGTTRILSSLECFVHVIGVHCGGKERRFIFSENTKELNQAISILKKKRDGLLIKKIITFPSKNLNPFSDLMDFSVLELTDRQREILKLAINMGWYDIKKKTTLQEIANKLDITEPTLSEIIRRAENKIILKIARFML
jgi:hypothetical protein